MTFIENTVECFSGREFYRLSYREYPQSSASSPGKLLFCVHGLTRNSSDFHYLASSMQEHYTVICPDIVGRGKSDFLTIKEDYNYNTYISGVCTLIAVKLAQHNTDHIDWVGTSMGGIIGMRIACCTKSPIRLLVLNDIGGFIPKQGLLHLSGPMPSFESLQKATDYFKDIHKPFGLNDSQWATLAQYSTKKQEDKGVVSYTLHYDYAIGHAMRDTSKIDDLPLWVFWDKIACPTMVLRGKDSDILTADILELMKTRGPGIKCSVEFDNIGHAPGLMTDDQVQPIKEFLCRQ